jgi:hypothetical protein
MGVTVMADDQNGSSSSGRGVSVLTVFDVAEGAVFDGLPVGSSRLL